MKLEDVRRIMSIDAESNGLHGEVFAVGAVVLTLDGKIESRFYGRAPTPDKLDPWVARHVVPSLDVTGCGATYADAKCMRDAFWEWFLGRKSVCLVVADCGWPVEAGLFSECVRDAPRRSGEGPYPLHEVATLLLAAGMDPLGVYDELCPKDDTFSKLPRHHPVRDALQSAGCALEAIRRIVALRETKASFVRKCEEVALAAEHDDSPGGAGLVAREVVAPIMLELAAWSRGEGE